MRDSRRFWFPAKRYGWGWGPPVTWQGWAVLIAYFLAIGAAAVRFLPAHETPAFLVATALLTAALLVVCWRTGEPPAWRRGGK